MPNTLWLWVFRALSSQGFLSQRLRGGLLSNDKSRALKSEQPTVYGCGGGLFIATRQPDLICPKWPWVTKELTRVPTVRFQTHAAAWLGLQVKLLIRLWIRFALIVFARRHRIWLSITSVTLTLFTWTPLNSTVVPMTQQRRKGNYETTMSSHSIVFKWMSSHVIIFIVNVFTNHHCLQCLHTV